MSKTSYTEPKARRVRSLAQREEFQQENGEPDLRAISSAAGVSLDVARFILTGELSADKRKAKTTRGDPLS